VAEGRAPQVLEDGRQLRDFVHVRDIARANVAALEHSLAPGEFEAVNVCSGTPHSIGDLAAALGGPAPEIVGGARAGDVRHVVADPAKALRLLGFCAQVGFTEGMREFSSAPLR
jgi:dTDP-L-rhamnose 4-epimerase